MPYVVHLLIQYCLTGIAALGMNLAVGGAGLIHLGYVALIGVGAYASALLLTVAHVPFPIAVLAGVALGAAVGWVVGLPTREVRGDAFALATLTTQWIFLVAALSWATLTNGALGVVGIPRPAYAAGNPEYLLIAVAALAGTYALVQRIARSPFGRVLGAIRDDEIAARAFGKRTIAAKRACLAIVGGIAGLSGALTASLIQFINPTVFWLPLLITLLTALLFGGVGNPAGVLAGLAALTAIGEGLRNTPLPEEHLGALRIILASTILLGVLLFRPRGLLGKIDIR